MIVWTAFAWPGSKNIESDIVFAESRSLLTQITTAEIFGPFENPAQKEKKPAAIQGMETLDVAEAMNSDVLEKCASLLEQGIVCMFINSPQMASYDPQTFHGSGEVMQRHLEHRAEARRTYEEREGRRAMAGLNSIAPAAGLYAATEQNIFARQYDQDDSGLPDTDFKKPENLIGNAEDDTVTQAALRAAVEMVSNRYTDALHQAQMNGGETGVSAQDAVSLTQNALSSAAERAFEAFMRDSFGKRDFEGRTYEGLRGYFMTAFKHAAATSVKSIGRRFVQDATAGGDFKNLAIRSELLDGINENIASAFIDTGLAAAKNSQYAFLRNLEVSYKIRENSKPEYSILTVQPIYSSSGKKHNLFAQAALSREGPRTSAGGGLGYRYMPGSENYVVGSNIFLDFERPYNHMRASAGLDVQTSLLGASANYYKGISDWNDSITGFQEQPMDGYDLELTGRMPFLPALEVFGRGYRWQGIDGVDDIDGTELRLEYSPVPAFTLEGLMNNEDQAETEYGLGLRYNYTFGAPSEYLYDWQEQFRQKSASEYIFTKARRENKIRVQERIDPNGPLGAGAVVPVGPAFVGSAPLDGAVGVSIGTDVVLTFAADVFAGVGNLVFTDLTDASDDFTIPVGDARVGIVNNVVTVDLSAQLLEFSSNYEVTFAAGVFTDAALAPSPELIAGDVDFTTVVDPTAGFPAATVSIAPNTLGPNLTPRNTTSTFQTTIDVAAGPNGVIFESGGSGRGIAAWFHLGNLVFAAGQGNTVATGGGSIFGSFPIASIPQGLHHFVFVAKPTAVAEIGVYMDGIRIITQTTAAAMTSNEWGGTDVSGYGLTSPVSIRTGGNVAVLTNATLANNFSFYLSQQPASF